jgi:hypothetical protein
MAANTCAIPVDADCRDCFEVGAIINIRMLRSSCDGIHFEISNVYRAKVLESYNERELMVQFINDNPYSNKTWIFRNKHNTWCVGGDSGWGYICNPEKQNKGVFF